MMLQTDSMRQYLCAAIVIHCCSRCSEGKVYETPVEMPFRVEPNVIFLPVPYLFPVIVPQPKSSLLISTNTPLDLNPLLPLSLIAFSFVAQSIIAIMNPVKAIMQMVTQLTEQLNVSQPYTAATPSQMLSTTTTSTRHLTTTTLKTTPIATLSTTPHQTSSTQEVTTTVSTSQPTTTTTLTTTPLTTLSTTPHQTTTTQEVTTTTSSSQLTTTTLETTSVTTSPTTTDQTSTLQDGIT